MVLMPPPPPPPLSISFQVVSDPVGYGFVIRGSKPVYVHTVDPSGPAAACGLKVSLVSNIIVPS